MPKPKMLPVPVVASNTPLPFGQFVGLEINEFDMTYERSARAVEQASQQSASQPVSLLQGKQANEIIMKEKHIICHKVFSNAIAQNMLHLYW